ncbi:MAG TPA: YjbQ family protein [Chloroflexi bacterium]|nr:YjbQ family protein [Chloroflexota bacterium]
MFIKLEIQTRTKVDLLDVTTEIQRTIMEQNIHEGICFVFCPHTTAGIVLNENWDPDVERDVALLLERMAPDNLKYRHAEGNTPSHMKSILVGSDHFIFIENRQLQLGAWQGIFLAEFDGPRRRTLWLKIQGEAKSG